MIDVQPLVDWLIDGAPGAPTPDLALKGTCEGLVKAGVPVGRAEAFVRTLHPNIAGRSFVWRAGGEVEIREQSFAYLTSPAFQQSPMAQACSSGEVVRAPSPEPAFKQLVAVPMRFLTGQTQVVTFSSATDFTEEQLQALKRVTAPLSRIAEIFAFVRTATNLLSTYVGHNAGARILKGQIQLGDTETLKAVIWFSDLRGFTALTRSALPAEVIRALNDLFGCQIPAIEQRGGEVLKFMGDGLLAIFPYDDAAGPPRQRCDQAIDAVFEAFEALERMNAERARANGRPIQFGVALHLGEISYGNIGGANRLDFTCIGPAVNVAARLETVASKLGRPVVVSDAFAKLTSRRTEPLGAFELKGVDVAEPVHAPVR